MANHKSIDEIAAQIEAKEQGLPPVEQWHPELSGDIDIVINRDGQWFHEGTPFERKKLVQLFASILKREGDEYFLVTPVEKWRLTVEDLPFAVIHVEKVAHQGKDVLKFTTNTDDEIIADKQHPVVVEQDEASGEPKPKINVRRNLDARIHRNVFYQLVEWGHEEETQQGKQLVVKSGDEKFILGSF